MPKDSLNSAQKEAIEARSGNLLILAGPGTGKTRVITQKIADLVESGIAPERILAVTFSRKATQEMEERLAQHAPRLTEFVQISTLHAWCVNLIQNHGFRLGIGRKVRLMTESQSQLILRQLAGRLQLERLSKSSFIDNLIGELLTFFQDCKDEGVWPEDLLQFAQALPGDDDDQLKIKEEWWVLGDVYNSLQSYCCENGLIDFGDALLGSVRLLEEHPLVRQQVQAELDAILVDEFQDTNWIQIKLLRLIAHPEAHVAVVGDDDQAIYRFRGASYSAFQFFEAAFPNTKVVELTETYRLPPAIVRAASDLIKANGTNRFRPDKKLISKSEIKENVQVIQSSDYEQEAAWVVREISKLLQSGVMPSEIGVLVRAHNHAELFAQEAKRLGLPIQSVSHEALFDQSIVQDLVSILLLVQNPEDSISFLRLLDSPFLGLGSSEIFKFCQWAGKQRKPYLELLAEIENSSLKPETIAKIQSFKKLYEEISADSHRLPASSLLSKIYEESGAVKYLMLTDKASLTKLADFHRQLVEWERLQERKELQAILPLILSIARHETQLQSEEREFDLSEESIKILSVHSSKGLEFEYVFILSLVGRRFPGNFKTHSWLVPNELRKEKAPDKASHIEEERRLLYVGMTRAKKQLYLNCLSKKGTKPSLFVTQDICPDPKLCSWINWIELPAEASAQKSYEQLTRLFERVEKTCEQPKKSQAESLQLSYTQLEKYDRCPLAYWFSYVLRIPTPATASLVVGSAVHEALERFFKAIQKDESPNKESILQYYEEAYAREYNAGPLITERDHDLGKQALDSFYDANTPKFPKPMALEKAFSFEIGGHQVRGKIDRVDAIDASDEVLIIDYKTGKSRSNEKESDLDFAKKSLQFSIYALAAQKCFDWKVREFQFLYVYDNLVLSTTRDAQQIKDTEKKILEIAEQIQAENFEARPAMHCRYCEFNRLCPSAKL